MSTNMNNLSSILNEISAKFPLFKKLIPVILVLLGIICLICLSIEKMLHHSDFTRDLTQLSEKLNQSALNISIN